MALEPAGGLSPVGRSGGPQHSYKVLKAKFDSWTGHPGWPSQAAQLRPLQFFDSVLADATPAGVRRGIIPRQGYCGRVPKQSKLTN